MKGEIMVYGYGCMQQCIFVELIIRCKEKGYV